MMRKVMIAGVIGVAGIVSACSGRGEIIPTPAPASEPTTTAEGINAGQAAGIPVTVPTTEPVTTTTEPEPEPTTPPRTVPPIPSPPRTAPATTTPDVSTLDYGEWAIPRYIVSCETGGTFDWYAYNPSGASGPYQLMPMHFGGELAMNQSRAAQHAKAAELWNGGRGRSHWAACL